MVRSHHNAVATIGSTPHGRNDSEHMPRQADHDQRRRQIAEAVWRLAAGTGLEGVTLRQVATEAGVSARLLQYYFGTRDELLLGALALLNADAERRAHARISALGDAPGPRALVRAVLMELLPLDDERRAQHLVHVAYFVRFLADPHLGALVRDAPPALEALVADLIQQARPTGAPSPGTEAGTATGTGAGTGAEAEATFLVAATEGLQSKMLLGQLTAEQATAVIDHQLARLFGPAP
jgi:AcrR family transcriptional regulator